MFKLNIRKKFLLTSFGAMLTLALILSVFISQTLKNNLDEEIAEARDVEVEKIKEDLQGHVELAYTILDEQIAAARQEALSLDEAKKRALLQIEKLRFDAGKGYFWINDTGSPYPKMVMHPMSPELNGRLLDDPKYNCAMGRNKNLFVAFAEICKQDGAGFVDYQWPKPTRDGLTAEQQPKLSYVRHYEPFGWVIGAGKYLDDIDAAVDLKNKQHKSQINSLLLKISGLCAVAVMLVFFPLLLVSKRIVRPILSSIDFAHEVGTGNLSTLVDIKSNDETGMLAASLNKMVHTMQQFLLEVSQRAALVLSASNHLSNSSSEMSAALKQVCGQSNTVAAATEEIAASISVVSESIETVAQRADSIADTSNRMSDNINAVSVSVGEMSGSIQNVAKYCSNAHLAASKAKETSDQSCILVEDLNRSAQDISRIVDVITEITEQTKLLALNATIEAARAGEAGKGFAVVANEVKELAKQTGKATSDIIASIEKMQQKTLAVVKMMQDISVRNQELNEINTTIAAAAEEQSVVAGEIAETVAGAAQGAMNVSRQVQDLTTAIKEEIASSIREASRGVAEVSANIQLVNNGVTESSSASAINFTFAREVTNVASDLRQSVGRFKLGTENFDIGKVKAAHLAWRSRLEGMLHLDAVVPLETIPDHTQCEFGKWLASPQAQGLQTLAAFPTMVRHHEEVHALAYRITDLYHKSRREEATKLMEEFEKSRQQLFTALDKLYSVSA
jgi:methyl-accepting chemotaxis protein